VLAQPVWAMTPLAIHLSLMPLAVSATPAVLTSRAACFQGPGRDDLLWRGGVVRRKVDPQDSIFYPDPDAIW
jgi:hypothetical protein